MARGWSRPVAWIGTPPDDMHALPRRLLVLLRPHGRRLRHSSGDAAAWRSTLTRGTRDRDRPRAGHSRGRRTDPLAVVAAAYRATLVGKLTADGVTGTGGEVVSAPACPATRSRPSPPASDGGSSKAGRAVTLLDGDEVRRHLSAGLGFLQRIGTQMSADRVGGGTNRETRDCGGRSHHALHSGAEGMRRDVEAQAGRGSFVLVHVATSFRGLRAAGPQGAVREGPAGEIPAFTGISDPHEAPTDVDVTVETEDAPSRSAAARPSTTSWRPKSEHVRSAIHSTMPAPTVALVPSSMKMKLPVVRLTRYGSVKSGAVKRSRSRPISLSARPVADSSRCRELMSRR